MRAGTFNCQTCTNGPARTINPAPITQTTVGAPLQIPFPSVRGGELSIHVQATIDVPAFTSSGWGVPSNQLGQVELDAVRGFNGWAGRDAFGRRFADRPANVRRRNVLHEFRVALDAAGGLIVDLPAGSTVGTIRWERVPAAARPQGVGDPNYVNNVLWSNPC